MELLGMDDEKGRQVESALHSNLPSYEQEDNQPSFVHEECYNLFDEECNPPIKNFVCGGFEEDLNPPLYDEYENDNLDNAPEEPTIYNHRLDHLKESKGPKWDVSSCSSNLECQEEYVSPDFLDEDEDSKWDIPLCFSNSEIILLDSIKEHNDISFEVLERYQV